MYRLPFCAKIIAANKNTTLPRGGGQDRKSKLFSRKGSSVDYSVYVMHRRKDIWGEDADEFKPVEKLTYFRAAMGKRRGRGLARIGIKNAVMKPEGFLNATIFSLQSSQSIDKNPP